MSCYFIAQIRITDDQEYQKYIDKAGDVFRKYRGEYLSVDNAPLRLEGEREYSRTVLIRFETKKKFEEWYYSKDYQNILKHRLNAAICDSILITGNP